MLVQGCAASGATSFDYGSYADSFLAAAVDAHPGPNEGQAATHESSVPADGLRRIGLSAVVFKYRLLVRSRGRVRRLDPQVQEVLTFWGGSFRRSEIYEFLEEFEEEVLVSDGSREMWMPIQKRLVGFWRQEALDGRPVELFAAWIGHSPAGNIFLVNAFTSH